MRKKRILHILMSMDIGGIENFIMNLYRSVDKDRYIFDFCLWKKGTNHYENEIVRMGGKIYKINFSKNIISNIIQFRKILKNRKYDVVHIHSHFYSGFFAYAAAKEKVPTVICHFHSFFDNKKNNFFRKIYINICRHLIKKYSNKLCACSEEAAIYGFGSTNGVNIIHNYINTNKFIHVDKNITEKIRKNNNISDDTMLLGTVGRLSPEKNQSYILEIASKLKDMKYNFKCLLVGDGPALHELKSIVDSYNLNNKIIFVGAVDNVNEYLNAMDIFLFPSLYEGFGMALLEAQASSCYCISSDTVPKSTDMGLGTVEYISLDNMDEWVNKIINYKKEKKSSDKIYECIKKNGYDTSNIVDDLKIMYGSEKNE